MLELTVFPPGFGEPTASPFAMKAWCLLEQSGQPYKLEVSQDPRKAPKGKFPVLRDGSNIVPDSDQIRDHLEAKYDIDFDKGLDSQERAASRAIIRMVEDHLNFVLLSSRWVEDAHWPFMLNEFFADIPIPMKWVIPNLVRKGAIAAAKGHGMGRFSKLERAARATKDLDALAALLGDKPFLFGSEPTAADFSTIPMLRCMTSFPTKTDLSQLIDARPELKAYMDRGKSAIYPKL